MLIRFVRAGLRVVQRLAGGACWDLLVALRRRHGPGAGRTAPRHVGLLPALPDHERLSKNGRWVAASPARSKCTGRFLQITWKTGGSTSTCETRSPHWSSGTSTWWNLLLLNRSTRVSRRNDGRSKGKSCTPGKRGGELVNCLVEMAVLHRKTCFGSWTRCSRSYATCTGPTRSSGSIWSRGSSWWLAIWSSRAYNGRRAPSSSGSRNPSRSSRPITSSPPRCAPWSMWY